ncbi:MAG: nitrate reductase associated protein [Cyanobacteria bacterium P01_A01_bin.3]
MSSQQPSSVPSPSHFQFESDFIESWRCIPMRVRLNLDTCGVKLKLVHWHALEASERQQLVEMPCETEIEASHYRDHLLSVVSDRYGSPPKLLNVPDNPAWDDGSTIPDTVVEKGKEFNFQMHPQHWANLDRLQRFALIKLSRPSHENTNFYPALQEFGLVE